MKVRRLGWLGIRTADFDATAALFRDVFGLESVIEETDFAMYGFPGADHDYVEILGPEAEDAEFEAEHYTTGPVPSLVVDDIAAARAELGTAGVELLGDITWSSRYPGLGWFHFRGPDGNVYGMMQGSRRQADA